MTRLMAALAAFAVAFATVPAQAKHHHYQHHHAVRHMAVTHALIYRQATPDTADTDQRYVGRAQTASYAPERQYVARSGREGVVFIPNPPGTWRVVASCAHRLAAYWGLGKGLDSVSTWPRVFPRVSGPSVGVAAVRYDRHHVMGIIGGSPGAWRVADFNSGGHRNREYTVANFHGYFFVDPRARMASR